MNRHWSQQDCELLVSLHAQTNPKLTGEEIAERFGVTRHAAAVKLIKLRTAPAPKPTPPAAPKPTAAPKQWTQEQAATAAQIWQDHFVDIYGDGDHKTAPQGATTRVYKKIAIAIGRDFQSVWGRYHHFGPGFGANGPRTYGKASAHALSAMAARKEAENRQTPIARLMGEPPPGYSALDLRKQQSAPR